MKLRPITRHLAAGALLMALPIWVQAAGLGKLVVTSALGQPLNAEIDLIAADKNELDSISAGLANNQAFHDANISYAPILSSLHFSVGKKPDGTAVLKITSTKPVNDPFLDMLVELNWASGRLVREYTVLLDPPNMAAPQTAAPMAVAAPSVTAPAKPAPAKPAAPSVAAPAAAEAKPSAKPAPAVAKPAPSPAAGTIKVKSGDTLFGIAKNVKPEGVTLEQTLMGLYEANTKAFFGNNMNRLKAGAKLKMPSADDMTQISQQKAVKEIHLQAADWQAYRQKLAQGATNEVAPAKNEQATSGKITAKVEDKAQPKSAEAHDVLKLSKAATPAESTAKASPEAAAEQKQAVQDAKAENQIAKEQAIKEAGERAAILEKQVQDMQKLVEEKKKKIEAEKTAKAPVVESGTQTENWIETLKNNPLYALGGGAIILLGGALWWMMAGTRKKKTVATFEDSIMTSGDLKPNTVMGGVPSGGAVNTGDSSFLTDFSQAGIGNIDTHDVDPIAEAEVYMAYGRDAQAEEILKEALVKTPDRQEIRVKLLEIYAARKNLESFEQVARELHAAVGEESPLWQKAAEMGRSIDPENPLYGGKPAEPEPEAPKPAEAAVPLAAAGMAAVAEAADEPMVPEAASFENAGHVLDFDSHMNTISGNVEVPSEAEDELASTLSDLNFDLSDTDLKQEISEQSVSIDEPAVDEDSKLDFSGLDLNLDNEMPDEDMDEVATKLDLARAYLEMGDKEGAREILQEVVAEGNSNQQASARSMLSGL